jgi:hypothetical protein
MMEKYMQAYEPQVHARPRPEEWPDVDASDEILPSVDKVEPGHPRKAMRRAPDEPTNPYKISCSGYAVTCGNCEDKGHNYKGCHLLLNPNQKRWNPKKRKTTETFSNVSLI